MRLYIVGRAGALCDIYHKNQKYAILTKTY